MSCGEFQGQLVELVSSGSDVERHPHLQTCERCRTLVRDLESIAEAARYPGFGDDGASELGTPAILPTVPNQGRGSAAAHLDSEIE
jgi:hypothetical protein